jgi:hypothetical protein
MHGITREVKQDQKLRKELPISLHSRIFPHLLHRLIL